MTSHLLLCYYDRVNTKILAIGSALIVFLFIGFAFYLGLRLREDQINQFTSDEPGTTRMVSSVGVTPAQMEKSKEELLSTRIIKQGVIVSYNSTSQTLSILENSTDKLEELELADLTEYKCWPENYTTPTGEKISIYGAFFPVKPDSYLFIQGEEKQLLSTLANNLQAGRKIISMVNLSSDQQATNQVYDLAVLGCVE